jgi:hemerythrin
MILIIFLRSFYPPRYIEGMTKITINNNINFTEIRANLGTMDIQHRTLLRMAEDLFLGCHYESAIAAGYFRDVLRKMLEYVRRHFLAEEIIMEKIRYPHLAEHRRQHRGIIKIMVVQISRLESDPRYTPGKFPRRLLGLIVTHIACDDQKYTAYYRQSPTPQQPAHLAESVA